MRRRCRSGHGRGRHLRGLNITLKEGNTEMSDQAKQNAESWVKIVREGMTSLQALETEKAGSVEYDGETFTDAESLRERLRESPLSVMVTWPHTSPGERPEAPEGYVILLSTGGPALRIVGDLSQWTEPENASLQWQDWGTPWTRFHPGEAADSVLDFARLFYFGEA